MRQIFRRMAVIGSLGLGAVLTGLTLAASSFGHPALHVQATRHSSRSAEYIKRVPPALARAFPVFGKARAAADAPPPDQFGLQQSEGVNLGLSREVLMNSAMHEWLAPGGTTTCLIWDFSNGTGGFGCAPNIVAETRGLVGGISGTMWFGAAPTGMSSLKTIASDGATTPVPVDADGGFMQPLSHPEGFVFTSASGAPIQLPSGPMHVDS